MSLEIDITDKVKFSFTCNKLMLIMQMIDEELQGGSIYRSEDKCYISKIFVDQDNICRQQNIEISRARTEYIENLIQIKWYLQLHG